MTTPVARRAARVLLVDAAGRVLLFRGGDPAAPEAGTWWFTPGGGLDKGESWTDGAVRELHEETGLRVGVDDLGAAVHAEQADFAFGGKVIAQDQRFFLLRVDSHDVDTSGFQELEAACIVEHRWWTLDELSVTGDLVYPRGLVGLLTGLGI